MRKVWPSTQDYYACACFWWWCSWKSCSFDEWCSGGVTRGGLEYCEEHGGGLPGIIYNNATRRRRVGPVPQAQQVILKKGVVSASSHRGGLASTILSEGSTFSL